MKLVFDPYEKVDKNTKGQECVMHITVKEKLQIQ